MSDSAFIIGIDLGTTNSAVATFDRRHFDARRGTVNLRLVGVPQVVGRGKIETDSLLPSFAFIVDGFEARDEAERLPWEVPESPIVGQFARERGADQPARLVASAKSWLCHGGVDRTAPILPWGNPRAEQGKGNIELTHRISPVAASANYLRHIRESWNAEHAAAMAAAKPRDAAKLKFESQDIVLTIPASFDEAARELTLQAAQEAGFPVERLTLVEEPLAALYAWIWRQANEEALGLSRGATIFVCDLGGGTTDFTLIEATRKNKKLSLRRVAVGEHLLLGGDNMDLALAVALEAEIMGHSEAAGGGDLKAGAKRLPLAQWNHLLLRTRDVKEQLIDRADDESASAKIVLPGAGSSLIRGTKSITVTAARVRGWVLDGFFPLVAGTDAVRRRASALGLTETGLPYAADPVVTRHIAQFLRTHAGETAKTVEVRGPDGDAVPMARPDFVLFNGGVFHSQAIRGRIVEQLNAWLYAGHRGERKIAELPTSETATRPTGKFADRADRLDHSVALGAAYYGAVRLGLGVPVESGSAHAIYIGVAADVPVESARIRAVCLIPRDFAEGGEIELTAPEFELLANTPVSFPIFSSPARRDQPGDVVDLDAFSVRALPPINTVLRTGRERETKKIPVRLAARVNAIGTLDLFCKSDEIDARTGEPFSWKLAFNLRHSAAPMAASPAAGASSSPDTSAEAVVEETAAARSVMDAAWEPALAPIRATFVPPPEHANPASFAKLIESAVNVPRKQWTADFCRFLADELLRVVDAGRAISAEHEARWLNLAGFALRPGFGFLGDSLRVERAWALYEKGPFFSNAAQTQQEWYVFWRRIAAGLDKNRQIILFNATCNSAPAGLCLQLAAANEQIRRKAERHPIFREAGSAAEALRLAATLERVPKHRKVALGEVLLRRFREKVAGDPEFWALGRLASREPFHATTDVIVNPETAAAWVREVLSSFPPDSPKSSGVFFLVQAGRMTGDRARDIDADLRGEIDANLTAIGVSAETLLPLREIRPLDVDESDRMAGEVLPIGLSLKAAD